MNDIHKKFSDKFSRHWIKVKFYQEEPKDDEAKRLKDVRFCEATKEAIMHPILLDKESISCPGARHAFGWSSLYKDELFKACCDKWGLEDAVLKSIVSSTPYFKKPFKYIGLNTNGAPDIIMSYMPPQEVMGLIKTYQNKEGGNLDVSLSAMMSICSGIAVRTYLEEKISLSFGCDDSRKSAEMRKENLAVGIPKRLLHLFVD